MERKPDIYIDGKHSNSGKVPENAVLKRVEYKEYYETPEYTKQQAINASEYFRKQAEMREDMNNYHG